ncbi:FHA domain-containing serine/threonine-protein kinase [Niabella hibiscisoli]|uniref:FHA domain-containing serine/threonine-protein kinase n=1 Tax=Niabella hibiscisoli TaxID=1825928 RepID=UPI001F1188A0|nr:FHA domain-containing serine/threonine-protein kinase [Niabella hibiscisoli]MCH5719151.1 FHA domain-containing serine/threonine-protein kinase [Niabella hibiscisoli]
MTELSTSYDILKVLGHGGFSAVFKARRKADGDIVALKQLDLTIENETEKEYRDFKEEVDILKKLDHPNIVKVYEEHILDHKPSLEMEFVDGETLETILKKEKYFSIDDTLDLIEQIAGALNYCHHYYLPGNVAQHTESALLKRNAVIHNDINPKNIIRTPNEDGSYRYVLIDFGLSFTDPNAVRHSKKEEGMAEYKSPEKWSGAMVDAPSDIYSFGIVIYETLTGVVPFPVKDYKVAGDMIQLEENHRSAAVPDMCKSRTAILSGDNEEDVECDIPEWLEMLVKKCLEKQPEDRFKTGRELSQFYYDGIEGKIEVPKPKELEPDVIDIDPMAAASVPIEGAWLEVVPNFITQPQRYSLNKEITIVGRWNDGGSQQTADFAIQTGDKFISKNHCQIIRRELSDGRTIYQLGDVAPSKNGTFYNDDRNTHRLEPHIKVNLKEGDYFWIGNTQLIFHGQ